jgi:hypothetical protein
VTELKDEATLAVARLGALNDARAASLFSGDRLAPVSQDAADAIYALRLGGKSEEEIARTVALPVEVVSAAIKERADAALSREAAERRIESAVCIARLDRMLEAIWPDVLLGDRHTIRLALEIEAQRRTLRGLDARSIQEAADRDLQAQKQEADPTIAELIPDLEPEQLNALKSILTDAQQKRRAKTRTKPRTAP